MPKAAELPAPLPPPEKGPPGGCGERTGAQQVALRPGALPVALRPGALSAALRHRARPRSPFPSARAAHPARVCAHRTLCTGFVSISGPGPRTGPPRHSGRHGAPQCSGPRLGEGRQDGPEAPPRGGRGRTPGSYAREPARSTLRPREWGGETEARTRRARGEEALVALRAHLPSFPATRRGLGPFPWQGNVLVRRPEVCGAHHLVDLDQVISLLNLNFLLLKWAY